MSSPCTAINTNKTTNKQISWKILLFPEDITALQPGAKIIIEPHPLLFDLRPTRGLLLEEVCWNGWPSSVSGACVASCSTRGADCKGSILQSVFLAQEANFWLTLTTKEATVSPNSLHVVRMQSGCCYRDGRDKTDSYHQKWVANSWTN